MHITTNVVSSNLVQARCSRCNTMWYNLSVTCDRVVVSPDTPVSSTNKTDRPDIIDILLKVTLNTITPLKNSAKFDYAWGILTFVFINYIIYELKFLRINISKFVFNRPLKKTGDSITMAAYMQHGSDIIDYETMCNIIASELTTGRVHICKQDPKFYGRKKLHRRCNG